MKTLSAEYKQNIDYPEDLQCSNQRPMVTGRQKVYQILPFSAQTRPMVTR